ncbi:hypothetical protein [Ideonella dechloratans]|uniref:hypothetical protein n=1 Tax=Ideonella dechloratans TaxID=36863 RepID=UPI0035B21C39
MQAQGAVRDAHPTAVIRGQAVQLDLGEEHDIARLRMELTDAEFGWSQPSAACARMQGERDLWKAKHEAQSKELGALPSSN